MKRYEFVSAVVYFERGATTRECVALTAEVVAYMRDQFSVFEFIAIDDTGAGLIDSMDVESFECPVRILELTRHHGPEAGMAAGLERAVGDWVFEIEGSTLDFSAADLAQMFDKCLEGYDIVALVPEDSPRRNRLFYWVVNRYSNLGRELTAERVRLVSRRALNSLLALGERVRYRKALYALTGLPFASVPYGSTVALPQRRLNRENYGLAFDVLLATSNFGLKIAHALSLTFFALSVLAVVYALVINFVRNDVVEGWTTLMILVAGGLGGLFLVLGVLGEYIARILEEVRKRPIYSVGRDIPYVPRGEIPDSGIHGRAGHTGLGPTRTLDTLGDGAHPRGS